MWEQMWERKGGANAETGYEADGATGGDPHLLIFAEI
jgi:hypothetical protein